MDPPAVLLSDLKHLGTSFLAKNATVLQKLARIFQIKASGLVHLLVEVVGKAQFDVTQIQGGGTRHIWVRIDG